MSKTKLTLRVSTLGKPAGSTIEVDTKEQADYLVDNGNAVRADDATDSKKS